MLQMDLENPSKGLAPSSQRIPEYKGICWAMEASKGGDCQLEGSRAPRRRQNGACELISLGNYAGLAAKGQTLRGSPASQSDHKQLLEVRRIILDVPISGLADAPYKSNGQAQRNNKKFPCEYNSP